MSKISVVADRIRASPAPVLIIDTCNYLDLFRRDDVSKQPRVEFEDIQTAADLLALAPPLPNNVHLVAPELVPGEFSDNADRIVRGFESWLASHDANQRWLTEAALSLVTALPQPTEVLPLDMHLKLRQLAEDLLARATVLDRDQQCLERAVVRLIAKRRPSHNKEMKDSMNLEQSLELSRILRADPPLAYPCVFVSSNTNDFAAPKSSKLHADLQADFDAASLLYFTSLRAAVGSLRAQGLL